MTTALAAREQTRARHPDEHGWIERDGDGAPAFLLPPTYEIVLAVARAVWVIR